LHSRPPSRLRRLAAAGTGAILAGTAAAQAPRADYGDAPDVPFPTRYASAGVYHVDTSREWLGFSPTSTTTTELDTNRGGDLDDGGAIFFAYNQPFGAPMNLFHVAVSYDPAQSSAAEIRYLNVLIDLDGDGAWEEGSEWPIRNYEVPFAELPAGSNSLRVVLNVDSTIPIGVYNSSQWTRVTISTTPVADGSGAWGRLERGETEDFRSLPGQLPPDKLRVLPSVLPTFVPVRPRQVHGAIHAADGADPDAHFRITFPPNAVGRKAWAKVWWRRVRDWNPANQYAGSIGVGGEAVALPPIGAGGGPGPWSALWTRGWVSLPPGDTVVILPVSGAFPNSLLYGDTDVALYARLFFDPSDEFVYLDLNQALGRADWGKPAAASTPGNLYAVPAVYSGGSVTPPQLDVGLSSPYHEASVAMCLAGRQAWISSNRPGGAGGFDLWYATRLDSSSPFSAPMPSNLNTVVQEWFADLSEDGLEIVFTRSATMADPGDLCLCRRPRPDIDFDPADVVALAALNTADDEGDPSFSADGLSLYFQSDRAPGQGRAIWQATRPSRTALFANPVLVVDTPADDHSPAISASGNLLVHAVRHSSSDSDLRVSYRPDEQSPFGPPQPIDVLRSLGWEANGQFERADSELWFVSDEASFGGAGSDVYRSLAVLPGLAASVDAVASQSGGLAVLSCASPDVMPIPADFWLLVLSGARQPSPLSVPGVLGPLQLDPANLFMTGFLPSLDGMAQFPLLFPPGLPPGLRMHFQTAKLHRGASTALSLSVHESVGVR